MNISVIVKILPNSCSDLLEDLMAKPRALWKIIHANYGETPQMLLSILKLIPRETQAITGDSTDVFTRFRNKVKEELVSLIEEACTRDQDIFSYNFINNGLFEYLKYVQLEEHQRQKISGLIFENCVMMNNHRGQGILANSWFDYIIKSEDNLNLVIEMLMDPVNHNRLYPMTFDIRASRILYKLLIFVFKSLQDIEDESVLQEYMRLIPFVVDVFIGNPTSALNIRNLMSDENSAVILLEILVGKVDKKIKHFNLFNDIIKGATLQTKYNTKHT